MRSTLEIFRHLYKNLPPLFPEEIAVKMRQALSDIEKGANFSVEQVEDIMIKFGYELWPYNQTFKELLEEAEKKVGTHFLLPRLSAPLQEKYEHYNSLGMTIRDLHSGAPADYFTTEERGELCAVLVEMQNELRVYAARDILSLRKKQYLARVEEFKKKLAQIAKHLQELKKMADKEHNHPNLAAEIRVRVRAFEHGFCLLGPELDYEAVCQSVEHFQGRKKDLNRLRGIHETVEIDFYSEE